jgi:hypothetical protein
MYYELEGVEVERITTRTVNISILLGSERRPSDPETANVIPCSSVNRIQKGSEFPWSFGRKGDDLNAGEVT